MRDYMITLGSVLMMIAVSDILMPEGDIKKFASLAMGFMVITAAVMPLGNMAEKFKFDASSFEIDEEKLRESEAEYRAEVIKKHRENLALKIQEKIKHGSKVTVEVYENGEISSVTIVLKGDESAAVAYITDTLKLPRERIKLIYENN